MTTTGWLILGFPLAGSILIGLLYRRLTGVTAGIIGTVAIAASFVCAILTTISLQGRAEGSRQVVTSLWDYAVTAGIDAKLSILIDPLSLFMALVVSGVSMLIHLYAVSYMASDRGYVRFFAYLNFFVFSMLLLVMASNFLILIVGWAFVGAASYLLISFWYRRETATAAGIKAFVINVVGDIGLVLGTFFIFKQSGTLNFLGTFAQAPKISGGDLTAGCILLLVGAFAKSAQVPLHTWLPDAMEGPTPVSALIHAATMVTAGVYLIARMWPLFEQAPAAQDVGEIIGAITLLIAATTALAQTDLKRVIAYSTMSQIGYMIMGVSAGAYVAGMFHLMTHAFFKALLFMAAGSVIAAMAGEQNMDRMGGFRKAMPFTFICFVIGGLSLSGIPPFSGFWSKDEIISLVAERGGWNWILFVVGYIGSFLTAVYTWRMIFRTFWGDPVPEAAELEAGHLHHAEVHRNPATGEEEDIEVGFPGPDHHIAEREPSMKVAMAVLAVLATIAGALELPFGIDDALKNFLAPTFQGSKYFDALEPSDSFTALGLVIGATLGILGIALAYRIWVQRPGTATRIRERFTAPYKLFKNKWYFDEIIDTIVIRPWGAAGRWGQAVFERVVVDGALVGGTTGIVRAAGAAVRALESGFLRAYAALVLVGLAAVALYFLIQAS
jgi:NADH-quinone oxidoreductase subunit L